MDRYVVSILSENFAKLGVGTFEDVNVPTKVVFHELVDDNIVFVACGDRHSVFLTSKGRAYVTGANFNYQLGLGHNVNINKPTLIEQLVMKKIRRASCGSRHTVLISAKGRMYSAGFGAFGQLGHGDFEDKQAYKKIENDWFCSSCSSKEHVNVALSSEFEGTFTFF